MADGFGIDIPPELDRIFIIEELLEITALDWAEDSSVDTLTASNGSAGSAPETELADSGSVESVPLPRQYNITFIEVMIRDPFWAFVFWEIKVQDKEQFEKAQDFDGYYLKVSPLGAPAPADPAQPGREAEGVFTVPVSVNDTAWYLGLSPAAPKGKTFESSHDGPKQYKVELCAGTKENETILAVSSPFGLPLPHELPAGWEPRLFAAENPVVMLSGYEDFRVVRKNERLPRTKRSTVAEPL